MFLKTEVDKGDRIACYGGAMRFLITGIDTSGSITLRRDTAVGALKKASELAEDGCWDIAITSPDGHRYTLTEFDQLQRMAGLLN